MQSADRSVSRHDAKVTAGRHVADLLRTEILSGSFACGTALPTEAEQTDVCLRYGPQRCSGGTRSAAL